jgi:hypothetical protein
VASEEGEGLVISLDGRLPGSPKSMTIDRLLPVAEHANLAPDDRPVSLQIAQL